MIKVKNVSKLYNGFRAVDNVSLEIEKGEFFGLIGSNGAGKTTLISIMVGMLKPSEGEVLIDGESPLSTKNRGRIGIVFQENTLYDNLTVRENLKLFASMNGIKGANFDKKLKEISERLDMSGELNKIFEKLSGGNKKKANIAIALLTDPDILFLDEPTTGLDPGARAEIHRILQELNAMGKTIILTTHYLEEAKMLCSRVGVMTMGKIVAIGSPEELIQKHARVPPRIIVSGMLPEELRITRKFSRKDENSIIVEVSNLEKDVPSVVEELFSQGIIVDTVVVKRPSLDDAFIALTGKQIDVDETVRGEKK